MGLLQKIKDFFNKNIECGEEIDSHIVFPYLKKKFLYLNKNIVVRENTTCVIVYKYKVCDVLIPGKYKINSENLPETFHRAKVNKLNKKGVKLRRLRADIYFVNTKELSNFTFMSDEPFSVKSIDLGRVMGFLQGTCVLRVIDSERIVKALIAENGKAKLNEIPYDIGLWIGNKINKTIEKQKINTNLILTEQNHVQNLLNTCLEDGYDNLGLFVKNIKLKAVDFPKKYKKKVNAYMFKNAKPIRFSGVNSNLANNISNNKVSIANTSPRIKITTNQSAMQNIKNTATYQSFKECSQCGAKFDASTKICKNCGKEI